MAVEQAPLRPRAFSHWLACGLGAGCLRPAPGTWGTLAAVPLYLLLSPLPLGLYLLLVVMLLGIGVWACEVTACDFGVHDHPSIVWDEVVGYLLTMAAAPSGWLWLVAGFALFRLFDIWKPWPVRLADQRVTGGWGIMLDDVLAAGYAWLAMQAVHMMWLHLDGGPIVIPLA